MTNKRIHNNNPLASVCFQAPLVVSIRSFTQNLSPSPCYRTSPNVRTPAPTMRASRLPLPYDSRFVRSKASQRNNSNNNNTVNQPDSVTTTSTSPSETSEQQQSLPSTTDPEAVVVSSSAERDLNEKRSDDPLVVTDDVSSETSNDAQQSVLNESSTLNETAPVIDTDTENEPVEIQSTSSTSSPLKQSETGGTDAEDPSVMQTSVVTVDKQSEKFDRGISSSTSTGANLDNDSNGSSTATIENVSKIDQLIPDTPQPSFDGGNINKDGSDNNNGGGDNNEDDDDDDDDSERSELIRSLKLNEQEGKQASLLELRQLDAATRLPMLGWLASRWPALRERLGANPRLSLQMGVEICVGAGTKTLAEIQGRADKFWKEFDFVLSDLALEIFGDAILVWLLSPVVRASFSPIPRHFSQIGSFNASSRLAALFVKGFQFGCAGFLSSVVGHGLTRSLVSYRNSRRSQSNAAGDDAVSDDDGVILAPVMKTSLAWGSFMAISSNIRYQMVNGVEQRMLEPLFGQFLPALTAVTFALRLANCYVGSMMWLPWAKAWDLQ